MDQTDQYISRVENLPPTPTIAVELLDLFKDSDRDLDRIVQLISHDPSLTAEVMKRCNSAFLRRGYPAADMFEAITRVGFYEVYCIVVTMLGSQMMGLARADGGLDATSLWRHSVTTAVAASTLAAWVREDEAAAFTAGLLHDVGKLILASVEPVAYSELVSSAAALAVGVIEMEPALLGATHASVGGRLLDRWGLPPEVILAVSQHHDSPAGAAPCEPIAAAVNLANVLVHSMAEICAIPSELPRNCEEAMRILSLTKDDLPGVIERTAKGLERVQGMLGLTLT